MICDFVVHPFVAAPEGADIVAARQLLSGGGLCLRLRFRDVYALGCGYKGLYHEVAKRPRLRLPHLDVGVVVSCARDAIPVLCRVMTLKLPLPVSSPARLDCPEARAGKLSGKV